MDARKIQFLIAIQREIDKLEAQEGESTRVERLKSRFYDVVEIEEMTVGGHGQQSESSRISGNSTVLQNEASNQYKSLDSSIDDQIKAGNEKQSNSLSTRHPKTDEVSRAFPHKPKDVANFMKLFDDANGLKYLTHEFDEPNTIFHVDDFLSNSEILFKEYDKKYIIPKSLWSLIENFAFKEAPDWTAEKQIKEGWASPKWKDWARYNGHPLKNRDFENIVQSFRKSTRVKNTLDYLINLVIDDKFKEKRNEFNFKFFDLDKADFYTYVVNFRRGLRALFDEICERPKYPNVSIRYKRSTENDYRTRIIEIFQEDSYPTNKTLGETLEKYKKGGGHLWNIRQNLFGYCDWHIETIWDDKPIRLHLLKEGMKDSKIEFNIEELEAISQPGFVHTLIFYFK